MNETYKYPIFSVPIALMMVCRRHDNVKLFFFISYLVVDIKTKLRMSKMSKIVNIFTDDFRHLATEFVSEKITKNEK